jgi:DNA-binding MarR family transcriptional regulator
MDGQDQPRADPFDTLLGYHLRRASVAVMTDFTTALAPLNLTPAEASVLFVIGAANGVTQAEIGRVLGIQRANMAPLMARLLKARLVKREAVDGRSQALTLSRGGREIHDQARAAAEAHEDRIFGHFSPAERARILVRLREIWREGGG